MSSKARVTAVATQKGCAGKSTIAIHLAVQAMQSRKNAQVVLLDLDPQGSVSGWARLRALEDPIVLAAMSGNLSAYLGEARADGADYVVIDTPPHAGTTIDAAIRAADLVVIRSAQARSTSMPRQAQWRSCARAGGAASSS